MRNEVVIRLSFFFGVLVLVSIWELLVPRRVLTASKPVRWLSNLGIVFLDTAVVRLVFPIMAVGMAHLAQQRDWGLLNNFEIPYCG